jgi:hypothetical protein
MHPVLDFHSFRIIYILFFKKKPAFLGRFFFDLTPTDLTPIPSPEKGEG